MRKSAYVATALVVVLAASAALAGAEIPLEAYGRLPTVDSMAVAPDGDRVAFRRTTDEMDAVFVLDRRSGDIKGVVDSSKTKLRQIRFLDQDRVL